MVFFLSPQQQVIGRYGGRDAKDSDSRMSLPGLRYAMQAALETHRQAADIEGAKPLKPKYLRQLASARNYRGCIHCHQAREILNAELKREKKWTREMVWRYPLPENVGLTLEVDRGDVVKRVMQDSPAAQAGIQQGDRLESIHQIAIHSFADAQYALDRAPGKGKVEISWQRADKRMQAELELAKGWRKTDLTWRPSLRRMLASARVFGRDLNASERKTHGLTETQLAFWQRYPLTPQAKAAGVQEEDIILGFDDVRLEMKAYDFLKWVRQNYLIGDRVTIHVLREGKTLKLPLRLNQ